MPASLLVQFSLITTLRPTLTSAVAWSLLMGAMTVPYVFAGITVSLALTRSPFPVSLVYGVDLLGAALGCAAVVLVLDVLDGPTAILFSALIAVRPPSLSRAAPRRPERRALMTPQAMARRPLRSSLLAVSSR